MSDNDRLLVDRRESVGLYDIKIRKRAESDRRWPVSFFVILMKRQILGASHKFLIEPDVENWEVGWDEKFLTCVGGSHSFRISRGWVELERGFGVWSEVPHYSGPPNGVDWLIAD